MSLSVLNVIRRQNASRREKMFAAASVVGFTYVTILTITVTYLSVFEIVPLRYGPSSLTARYHLAAILFLFLNVAGNFTNVIRVKSHVNILKKVSRDRELPLECPHCQTGVPRRTHHCRLCNVCVLKRDHHCVFMCTCIGYFNQKYFIMFCLYVAIGGAYTTVLMAMYLHMLYQVQHESVFTVFTLGFTSFHSWWTSSEDMPPVHKFCLVGIFTASFTASIVATTFVIWQMYLVLRGQTSYEAKHGITKYGRSVKENFLDVFGPYWYVTLVLPIPLPQFSDGTYRHGTSRGRGRAQ